MSMACHIFRILTLYEIRMMAEERSTRLTEKRCLVGPGSAWETCRLPGSAAVDRFNYSIFTAPLCIWHISCLTLSFEFCWGYLFCIDVSLPHLCICHPLSISILIVPFMPLFFGTRDHCNRAWRIFYFF